jgi:hypothetical protein
LIEAKYTTVKQVIEERNNLKSRLIEAKDSQSVKSIEDMTNPNS